MVRMEFSGSGEGDWNDLDDLARRHLDLIIPAFGIHRWYVHEPTPTWKDQLNRCLDEIPGAVVGEPCCNPINPKRKKSRNHLLEKELSLGSVLQINSPLDFLR